MTRAKPLTAAERLRNVERRLELLEKLYMEFRFANAHLHVGGRAWEEADRKAIQETRHAE